MIECSIWITCLPFTVFRLHQNILVSTCVGRITRSINPLTPKSDKHLISPYNITPKPHIKVTTKKEMITKDRNSRLLNKFSLSTP